MEVHHHPQHKPKHIKEYFFEYVMIVLAVATGFFSENLREDMSNKERLKQNIESLVKSVQEDTAALRVYIRGTEDTYKGLDSFMTLKNEDLTIPANKVKFYYYVFTYMSGYPLFTSNKEGIEQIKNSGTLRLIKKTGVIDSIFQYEAENRFAMDQGLDCKDIYYELDRTATKVFDMSAIRDKYVRQNLSIANCNVKELSDKLEPVTTDKLLLKEMYNNTYNLIGTYKYYDYMLKHLLKDDQRLIALLKADYNIK